MAAGFDASKNDDLGMCKVSNTGFAHMTHLLKALSGGKLALILEVNLFIYLYEYIYIISSFNNLLFSLY